MKKFYTLCFFGAMVLLGGCESSEDRFKRDITCLKMHDLKKRFDMFSLDNGTLPSTNEGIGALLQNPNSKKYPNYRTDLYLKKTPKDYWGNSFVYRKLEGYNISIISYGADSKEGGSGINADILLSECKR